MPDPIARFYPDFRVRVELAMDWMMIHEKREMRVTDGFRTISEQRRLYKQGRTEPGRVVTDADGGLSAHNYGLAADLCFRGRDPYLQLETKEERARLWKLYGDIVTNEGMKWGGSWKDTTMAGDLPHCEITYGLKMSEISRLYVGLGSIELVWGHLDQIRGVPIGMEWATMFGKGTK